MDWIIAFCIVALLVLLKKYKESVAAGIRKLVGKVEMIETMCFIFASVSITIVLLIIGVKDIAWESKQRKFFAARDRILTASANSTEEAISSYEYVDSIKISHELADDRPWGDITIDLKLAEDVSSLTPKQQYEYLYNLEDNIEKVRGKAIGACGGEGAFSLYIRCGGIDVGDIFEQCGIYHEEYHYCVECSGKRYDIQQTYYLVVDGDIVYDARPEKTIICDKRFADTNQGSVYRGGNSFNERILSSDPYDYDSPDDFADDAWGLDFDDWDDAYDFWENW